MENKYYLKPATKNIFGHIQWQNLFAGVAGGVISTAILHPLDLLKVRWQVRADGVADRPNYQNLLDAISKIKQAGPTAFFQGATPNIIGAGASWGFYFFFYSALKRWQQCGNENLPLAPQQHMAFGAASGALTLSLTNPLWVAKTRLCLQYETSQNTCQTMRYSGLRDCLVKTYRYEGISGLYRGFLPGLFGVSHGAIQFTVYEEMKNRYALYHRRPITTKLSVAEYVIFSALSKTVAVAVTYPYQVVRTRLQDQHRTYAGSIEVMRQLLQNEGWTAFYKGIFPALVRVVPATCITFLVYENLICVLRK